MHKQGLSSVGGGQVVGEGRRFAFLSLSKEHFKERPPGTQVGGRVFAWLAWHWHGPGFNVGNARRQKRGGKWEGGVRERESIMANGTLSPVMLDSHLNYICPFK